MPTGQAKTGYKAVPPIPKKGRKLTATQLSPWSILLAMYRAQRGEIQKKICEDLHISQATLKRWLDRWGGDVVHVRPAIQTEEIQQITAALQKARRTLKAVNTEIEAALNNITGNDEYWRAKRDAGKKVEASAIPKCLTKPIVPREQAKQEPKRPDFLKLS